LKFFVAVYMIFSERPGEKYLGFRIDRNAQGEKDGF
jgi:hypothetical protein